MSNVVALASRTPIVATPGAEVIDDPYLSPEQVCGLVPGMTVANLKDLRNGRGAGPAYFKPTGPRGHITLYRLSDVVAWIESSRSGTREQR